MFWAYLTKTQKDKTVCNLIISYKKEYLYIFIYIWIQKSEGAKKTLDDDDSAHYLNCGDGFTGVYNRQNLSNYTS